MPKQCKSDHETAQNSPEKAWAEAVAGRILEKEREVAARNADKIPYTANEGHFDDKTDQITWWTNGFWAGQLWLLYHAFGDELFREIAEKIEVKLDANLMDYMGMDHDSGFKWLLTALPSFELTGNRASKNRLLLAASNLAGRINPAGGFIRAWNDDGSGDHAGWAIIDCMMNLPLLYRASDMTADPRFTQIATAHADTAMKSFIRPDGSSAHIAVFDPLSGEFTRTLGGQGLGEGSSWTRGQSWALYGFTLSYVHTGREAYLETAMKVADYCLEQIPESGIMPVDYKQDADCPWEDSTAAAITACGLLELEKYSPAPKAAAYHAMAIKLLKTLEQQRCNWSPDADELLENCTAAYHDEQHNFPIIYGDYYFTEAILKLCGKDLFLW